MTPPVLEDRAPEAGCPREDPGIPGSRLAAPPAGGLAAFRELLSVPDDPFYRPRAPLWQPDGMRHPPTWPDRVGVRESCYALLINPFYPKDPHASYGKHVLTPTLALSSVAAATPSHWRVRIWDENLLQGPFPADPLPQVVGISVHLTFARRAYEIARWFRARGCRVVLGGMHVLSCPDEAAAHADALVLGEGATLWPAVLADIGALDRVGEGVVRAHPEQWFMAHVFQPDPG